MEPYVVRQGDYLTALAYARGADPDQIWNAPENAKLRELRKNPEILAPCDIVYLPPAPEPRWHKVKLGQVNTFVSDAPRIEILVKLPDFAGASYTADCDGVSLDPGCVGADGTLSCSVPVIGKKVLVTFESLDESIELRIGHLDPINTPSGQHQRLANLGFPLPAPDEDEDAHALRRATALFQVSQGLSPTGEFDSDTLSALVKVHGS
jgi:hypothetical protein